MYDLERPQFKPLEQHDTCRKCGAVYDKSTTCVPCAVKYATIALTIQEVARMHNCAWLGREYKCEHLAS